MHAKFLVPLLVVMAGCAVKPADKVAHGEDHNLIAKAELLGRPLQEVAGAEKLETGVPLLKADLSTEIGAFTARLDGDDSTRVVFEIGESYVTLSKVVAGALKPVLQFAVKGHFDLKNKTDDQGVKSQYLAKDDSANARWQDRAYVEVDPTAPLLIMADDETLRNLFAVAGLKDRTFVFRAATDLPWFSPDDAANLINAFNLKAGQNLRTMLSRRFLTVYRLELDDTQTLLAQAPVTYFDLTRLENANNEATPELKRDQKQSDWSVRAYVAVDPDGVVVAKPTGELMEMLHDKASLVGKKVKLSDKKAPLLSETPDLVDLLAKSAISVAMDDEVTYRITMTSIDILKGQDVILKYFVMAHVDIAPKVNAFGETTAILETTTTLHPWQLRKFVAVDARVAEVALFDASVADSEYMVVKRQAIDGQCFASADLPLPSLIADVKAAMRVDEDGAKICLKATQTVVSVYIGRGDQQRLALTYDVWANFDVKQAVSRDGTETDALLTRSDENPHWEQRAFIGLAVSAPHPVKDDVQPNTLIKGVLDGEFIYTSVVTAAHSENGMVFVGWTSQSPDRLQFEVQADTVTAYKVHDGLSNSTAKTPVLRYSTTHFDVQRAKNSFGDETNVYEENTEKPWSSRANLRVDFASNQITNYLDDDISLQSLYGVVFRSSPRLASDIKIDDETISFDTEEVLTPNMLSEYHNPNDRQLAPVSVKIHHTFLHVGKRNYAAKSYSALDFKKFGFFETTEDGVDPILGKTDASLKHFMRRYDLAGGKHINYSLSPNFPEKYKSSARQVIAAWNVAFKAATGRDDVMLLDESGTKDPNDPRHSMMVYVDQRHSQEPLGYGPSVFDPDTGENISGKAYIYDSSIKLVMNMASDFYDLATGTRSVRDYSTTATMRGVPGSAGNVTDGLVTVTPMARALPKTATAARRFSRSSPVPFKLTDTLVKLNSQASLAPAARASEATAAFGEMSADLLAKLTKTRRISAHERFQGCEIDPEAHIASAVKFIQAHPGMSKDEVLAKLEESMMFSLLLHEVGHTLGLRHNFQGSFDEAGFSPKYFETKAAGGWTEQFRTSTTMDYLDDFEATDLAAGSYDVAAIKFGYGDKLEKVIGRDEFGATLTEDMPKSAFDAAVEALKAANPTVSANAIDAQARQDLAVRPYKFCTDEHVADDPTCNRFDRGISVAEITGSLITDYETRYQLYAFRRGRRDFTGSSSSIIPRFIMPVRQLLDEYIYNIINNSFIAQDNADGSPNAGSQSDYIQAINLGIGFLNHILETVEPGTYHVDATTGELVSGKSEEEGAKNVVIDLTTGKYLDPQFVTIGGRDQQILNRGIELDKIGVLYAMGMRGYPAEKYERAQLAVNYFDLLKEFTVERFSSVIREDLKIDLVTALGDDGNYHPVTDSSLSVDTGKPTQFTAKIAPSSSLAIREYAMIFASEFDNAGNRTFGDYVDYRLQGIDATFPATATTAEFTSTSGLKTYVVADTADGLSISYKIAAKAQEAAAKVTAARAALAAAPVADELKAQAIAKFGEAWLIGKGEVMGDAIVETLNGNFDANIAVLRLFVEQWVAAAEGPEQLAKITAIRDELVGVLDQYEAMAATRATLQATVDDGERALVAFESDLLHLKEMYNIFK